MSSFKGILDEESKFYLKYTKNTHEDAVYKAFRTEWQRKGIIKFANEVLKVDPEGGGDIQLSDGQINFLTQVTTGNVQFAVVCSARSTGKTFSLAVFVAYHIFVYPFYNITVIAGSQDQADQLQNYIKGWIRNNPLLQRFTWKNVRKIIKTYSNSTVTFAGLSPTSTHSKHVKCVIVDEEASGDEKGGTKYIRAALWQIGASKDVKVFKVSTIHAVSGDFIDTWINAEKLGYTRFTWSIAKHISGETDPYKVFADKNPTHWLKNIPWGDENTIRKLRLDKTDSEWLIEGLGAMSRGSGLVLNPTDIDAAVCDLCEECKPYEIGCTILSYYLFKAGIGDPKIQPSPDNPQYVEYGKRYLDEKVIGIDWNQVHPDCYTCLGRYGNESFVVDFRNPLGQSDDSKIDTAVEIANNWGVEVIRPDPEQWSYANTLLDKGYSVHKLWTQGGQEKEKYVAYLIKVFEHQKIHIPKIYADLIDCLKKMVFDEKNKVVKKNDHPFDSLLYALSYYRELDGDSSFETEEGEDKGARVWVKQILPTIPNEKIVTPEERKPEPKVEKICVAGMLDDFQPNLNITAEEEDPQFNPFDENYARKKRDKTTFYEGGTTIW